MRQKMTWFEITFAVAEATPLETEIVKVEKVTVDRIKPSPMAKRVIRRALLQARKELASGRQ